MEINMLFTHVYIDNLYGFNQLSVDLTLKRKPTASTIENEYCSFTPNFKVKKVCVLSGANASGKTAFGRVLCGIQNFISRHYMVAYLEDAICDKEKPANVTVEFVTPPNSFSQQAVLHSLFLTFSKNEQLVSIQMLEYCSTPIQNQETNTKARKRLLNIKENNTIRSSDFRLTVDFINEENTALVNLRKFREHIDRYDKGGWSYVFAEDNNQNRLDQNKRFSLTYEQLNKFIKAFDSSIERVETLRSDEQEVEGLKIICNNGDLVKVLFGKNGEIINSNRLSRGTLEAVMMTSQISRIKDDVGSNVYYIDEQMAYCHSEMEQAVLNVMIDLLATDCQLFYTTHNYDIVDMNLPLHSHYIFKKQQDISTVVNVGEVFAKNDRSILSYLKNDVFSTLPKTDGIDFLLFE